VASVKEDEILNKGALHLLLRNLNEIFLARKEKENGVLVISPFGYFNWTASCCSSYFVLLLGSCR
jgi:hypothetical protein